MKQKSILMGLVAILSLTIALAPTMIDDALALKSTGNPTLKFGSATKNIVCGDMLCSQVNTNTVAKNINTIVKNTNTVAEKTIKIEGLDVFYLEAGSSDAPTILLLHGFPTSSHMFRNLVPALANEFHVIAPDMIGYGRSSMPTVDEFEYTFDHQTQIIEQFTEKLKLDQYTLYMMDYGGPIGFRLFEKNPEKIQDELQLKQNTVSLRILTNSGDTGKFAKLISGGNFDFGDNDSSGYYFQAHLSTNEEFLKRIIIKHIRLCYPEMGVYPSTLSIFSFLGRDKVNDQYASAILKRITGELCNELSQDLGSVVIKEKR